LVEISLAVTAVLSVKCEQTGLHYMLTVTMPDVSTTGNDSEKVASVALHLQHSWQHRRWDGGLFGWHL